MSEHPVPGPLRPVPPVAAVLVFVALLVTLVLGVSPNVDTQLVALGELFWPGYANELRMDPDLPTCDLEELDGRLAACPAREEGGAAMPAGQDGDPFAGEDPFAAEGDGGADADPFAGDDPFAEGDGGADADPFAGDDPFAEGDDAPAADPFAGEDPFAEGGDAPAADPFAGEDPFAEGGDAPKAGAEPAGADPFAGDDPFAEGGAEPAAGTDPFAGDDPFAEGGAEPAAGTDPFAGDDPFADDAPGAATAGAPDATECAGLYAFRDTCQARWDQYDAIQARLNPTNRAYRNFEVFIGDLAKFPFWKHLLIVVVMLGGLATTVRRMPIALREPRTRVEHWLSQGAQLVSHGLLVASCVYDYQVQVSSETEALNPELSLFWAVGFVLLGLVNVAHLAMPPRFERADLNVGRLLMVVPLYAYMVIASGIYFLAWEQHPSGQAIYLHKFLQVPSVYLGIGLYLWAGMLFSITRFATLVFGVLRPLGLPPAILSWLVVVLAALPTAYSGASGIFVLAAGAVVFTELRRSGAPKRMALAATAMSGSLGVVLAPCLVVVLIAMLNNDVQTKELFGWGLWVFGLTAVLALLAFLVRNKEPLKLPESGALGGVGRALWALVPFVAIGGLVVVVFQFVLGTDLSEHTAMFVLPAVLLGIVVYDRAFAPERVNQVPLPRPQQKLWRPLISATAESSDHIGALLMLMIGSIALGGIVERTEVMNLFPADLGGPYVTMVVLVVIMVLVGMTMDALGAVVLVSVSVATLAVDAGIHPVHFWLMVLVAFELGYLTPPVALNHLLARQVIGEESHVEDDDTRGFLARNEHLLLPVVVMAVALLIVAFGGFLVFPPG